MADLTSHIKNIKKTFDFTLNESQLRSINDWLLKKHLFLSGVAGSGKAQPLWSKVLTPNGFVKMGDLSIGDKVIGKNGNICNITDIHPQGKIPIFKLTFKDDRVVYACENHLWNASELKSNRVRNDYGTFKTTDLIEWLNNGSKVKIPVYSPNREEIDKEFIIDPYVLGILIGDGSLTGKNLTFTSADNEIVEEVSSLIEFNSHVKTLPSSSITHSICWENNKYGHYSENIYLSEIKALGLNCKSPFKFIPKKYMDGSFRQRLSLLQGLLDSDGSSSSGIQFSTTSALLAEDIKELVFSLGGIAKIYDKKSSYYYCGEKKVGLDSFIVNISYPFPKECFRLKRKQDNLLDIYKNGKSLLESEIVSIESYGNEESQCISVDSEDHLYVTDNYVVTHNTWIAIYLAILSILNKEQNDIRIVRSLVPTRNIGFLPGEVDDKAAPFLEIYEGILLEVLSCFSGKNNDKDFMKSRVHFENTSFLRGKTWDNSIIYIDEVQNLNVHELHTVMTRVGKNSRVIVSGDYFQSDLSHRESCHEFLETVVSELNIFSQVNFYVEDIVRSDFVKDWCEVAESKLLNVK